MLEDLNVCRRQEKVFELNVKVISFIGLIGDAISFHV